MKGVISLRIEPSLLEELDKVAREEGKSRTGVIKEAVRYYLQHIHRKNSSEGFVPFLEFKKANDELKESLRRLAELEAKVAKLSKENEILKEELKKTKKRRWIF